MNIRKTDSAIHWIVIHLVDSSIPLLNNWTLVKFVLL